jgi:methylenetetrahydrofolate reductase (NADPH)
MKTTAISFEFFPPKTADGIEKLRETRAQLAKFNPEFFSVTFGAGGSTRDRTMDTVLEIQQEGFQAAPHISCVANLSGAWYQALSCIARRRTVR